MLVRPDIRELLKSRILILDGAMGTMIRSCSAGEVDMLSLTKPAIIKEIHEAYLEAGSDIITTHTFDANAASRPDFGKTGTAYEINRKSAQIAQEAAAKFTKFDSGKPRYVAGAIGPTNKSVSLFSAENALPRIGYKQLYLAYYEQAKGLIDGGVDLILLETIVDISNARTALYAINDLFKETNITLPLMLSFTITGTDGNILTGVPLKVLLQSLSDPGVFCIGLNCGKGIEQMMPFLEELSQYTSYYTCAYPSAGLPDTTGKYSDTPEILALKMKEIVNGGFVNIIGGCCGTTPDHIRMFARLGTGAVTRAIT